MAFGRQQGFTLLEMLVTLMLTSLVAVLLTQGVSQMLMLRERILEHTEFQRENMLRRAWFTDSINDLIADIPLVERNGFHGDSRSIQGLSLSPMAALSGVPIVMNWRLEADEDVWHLLYRESGSHELRVWSWRADWAYFSFFDSRTSWVGQWPPSPELSGLLPEAVLLTTEWRGEPLVWVAGVGSSRSPRPNLLLPEEFR